MAWWGFYGCMGLTRLLVGYRFLGSAGWLAVCGLPGGLRFAVCRVAVYAGLNLLSLKLGL